MPETLPSFLEFETILDLIGLPIMAYKRYSRRRFSIQVKRGWAEEMYYWQNRERPLAQRLRKEEVAAFNEYFSVFPRIDCYAVYPAVHWTHVSLELASSIVVPPIPVHLRDRRWVAL